jgi:O-antigen/teichoic acid export membrane protein
VSQQSKALESGAAVGVNVRSSRPARETTHSVKRVISGATLVFGGTMVWQASNFLFNGVGAHVLGPAGYGVLAASLALLNFATPLLAAIQAVTSRETTALADRGELAKIRPMLRHYGLRVTGGGLILGAIVAATSGWLSSLFHLGSPWLVVIIGAVIPGYALGHVLAGLIQGLERFGRFALESVVEGSAKVGFGILAMTLLWHSAFSGVAAVDLSCAVAVVTYLIMTLPLLARNALSPAAAGIVVAADSQDPDGPRAGLTGARPGVARYSLAALVVYGLMALMVSSDTLVAKHYLTNHDAGLYAGVSLTGKIAYLGASALFVVAFPLFSRHHDNGTSSRNWILGAGALVAAITGAIVVVYALEPAWVVIPLLGGRYRAVERYMPWMAAVYGLYALGYLVAIYLLARKCWSIIAVLAAALAVQFTGFYLFHSAIAMFMSVLAVAFAVLCGGGMLAAARSGRKTGTTTAPAGTVSSPSSAAPGSWQEQIVTEVSRRAGSVPVLLAGSRALGTAHADSDYDVSVVLPLRRIPRATPSLAEAARRLSADLGRDVSVNPVPRFRMRRPGGSLFVGKLQAEAVILAAPPGWSLCRQPPTGVTTFAATSALLSAAQILLTTFDPAVMTGGPVPSQAWHALPKAALHVAQVRLLRSGHYASDLKVALAELRSTPPGANDAAPAAGLADALTAGLMAADAVAGFSVLRQCIFAQLGEITDTPFRMPAGRCLVRNLQYAALAQLRGRNRWRAVFRRAPVEAALAETQLALLRALDPEAADGVDAVQLRLAATALPSFLAAGNKHTWENLRDLALAEWRDAHPLVGVMA